MEEKIRLALLGHNLRLSLGGTRGRVQVSVIDVMTRPLHLEIAVEKIELLAGTDDHSDM
jgi:hypothetical protein